MCISSLPVAVCKYVLQFKPYSSELSVTCKTSIAVSYFTSGQKLTHLGYIIGFSQRYGRRAKTKRDTFAPLLFSDIRSIQNQWGKTKSEKSARITLQCIHIICTYSTVIINMTLIFIIYKILIENAYISVIRGYINGWLKRIVFVLTRISGR